MKSPTEGGGSWGGRATSGRNVMRSGKRQQQIIYILRLCVVERNIFLGTLEAADGFPQIRAGSLEKDPGVLEGTQRAGAEGRAADGACPRASMGLFRWPHNNN